MRELDCKEGWVLKNWYCQTVVLEKTLESSLDSKEIKLVHPKGNQPWIFTGRTGAKAKAPIFWPSDVKSQLIGIDHGSGKDWGQEKKGMTEHEMVGWRHRLNGQEFEQTLGDSEGEGSLECCSPWGCKESDMTEWLNNSTRYYRISDKMILPENLGNTEQICRMNFTVNIHSIKRKWKKSIRIEHEA